MGAVTTTFIAGLEAIKRGIGKPIGSLTQLGTVRLGKRTEGRSPAIRDFVPLAGLEDIEVGCWDIFEDNAYEAAVKAGVLEMPPAGTGEGAAFGDQAHEGRLRPEFRQAPQRSATSRPAAPRWTTPRGDGRHPPVPEAHRRRAHGNDLVRFDRGLPRGRPVHATLKDFECGLKQERSGDLAQPDLRLRGAETRHPLCQRRAAPHHGHAGAAGTGAQQQRAGLRQGLSRAARRS